MDYQAMYQQKMGTVQDALGLVRSHDTIVCAAVVNEPTEFLGALPQVLPQLEQVTIFKGKENYYEYLTDPAYQGHVRTISYLFGNNTRDAQKVGMAEYIPTDLSGIGRIGDIIAKGNVFVAQATEMDENGYFQVSYCQMFERDLFPFADRVILEVNPKFQRVRGGLDIHISQVSVLYRSPKEPFLLPREDGSSPVDRKIGDYIADLIPDGSTIQLGIGRLPDAVAVRLAEKNDLGLHTEMFTSNMLGLVRAGNITGKYKTVDPGEHLGCFALGDAELYATLASNPACRIAPSSYTNDPAVIARQDRMISVNTCLEIDLLGQVASESIGTKQFSGTGGAADFAAGALRSKGGRGIIAFNATTKKGTISKIKPTLTPGAAVTIGRNLVDTVVTEYGVAELKGRTVPERVRALTSIAHPDFRDSLLEKAKKMGLI